MTREQVKYLAEVRRLLRQRRLTGVLKPSEVSICLRLHENFIGPKLAFQAVGNYRNQFAVTDAVYKYESKARRKQLAEAQQTSS